VPQQQNGPAWGSPGKLYFQVVSELALPVESHLATAAPEFSRQPVCQPVRSSLIVAWRLPHHKLA
ncbi:MAG: hypothetical protein ACRD2R_02820, partial [Terriglobales bacterium]